MLRGFLWDKYYLKDCLFLPVVKLFHNFLQRDELCNQTMFRMQSVGHVYVALYRIIK